MRAGTESREADEEEEVVPYIKPLRLLELELKMISQSDSSKKSSANEVYTPEVPSFMKMNSFIETFVQTYVQQRNTQSHLILCVICLALYIVYLEYNNFFVSVHLIGFLYTTFMGFTIIWLVDMLSQVAGYPIPHTPAIFFCILGTGMFIGSAIVCFLNYTTIRPKYGFLLSTAIIALITAMTFILDAVCLCWYK
ncbi:uncharacterized protein [Periplaneta americana]|uniref:uncharacterized protein n=1 Tax=Periplaneta americana TaxID=6978 RepID=UPI0037E83C27